MEHGTDSQHVNGHIPNGYVGNGSAVPNRNEKRSSMQCGYQYATFKRLFGCLFIIPLFLTHYLGLPVYAYPLMIILAFLPLFSFFVGINNILYVFMERRNQVSKIDKYIEFLDDDCKENHAGKFIPVRDLYELYVDGKLDFKGDVLECFERRNEFISYKLQWWHLKFLLSKLVPELLHGKSQDKTQVCDHYDRGNDFYHSFLGPMMVYTSGKRHSEEDTLEDMQRNKIDEVSQKILLKKTDRHLDIGCGWGTLCNAFAQKYGVNSTGVSIARQQVDFAEEKASESQEGNKAKFLCMDYREIPHDRFDKITCLEMAEHVGIRLFPDFLKQVYGMLDDNGIFFLQIAGLRRAWQWEDFLWGFFMDTYIFPGADASLPLMFSVGQLETAGFEVQSVETVGVHYSDTIRYWYQNWIKPEVKEAMTLKYGVRLYKVWEIFLAWSTIIARQGNSTCFQIVAHKNLNNFPRRQFMPCHL